MARYSRLPIRSAECPSARRTAPGHLTVQGQRVVRPGPADRGCTAPGRDPRSVGYQRGGGLSHGSFRANGSGRPASQQPRETTAAAERSRGENQPKTSTKRPNRRPVQYPELKLAPRPVPGVQTVCKTSQRPRQRPSDRTEPSPPPVRGPDAGHIIKPLHASPRMTFRKGGCQRWTT